MDEDRNTRCEKMRPGTLHFIKGTEAHRVVNTGNEPLVFSACWPSDAGYDYDVILKYGFGMRVSDTENFSEDYL